MQYRIPIKQWSAAYYNGGKSPAIATLKRRVDRGILPGSKASGEYVIYCDANYEPVTLKAAPKPPPATGNKIADAILQRRHQQQAEP